MREFANEHNEIFVLILLLSPLLVTGLGYLIYILTNYKHLGKVFKIK
jgi:hypothetical protein